MTPSAKERGYPDHYHLITTTDLRGKITAANEEFAEVAAIRLTNWSASPTT